MLQTRQLILTAIKVKVMQPVVMAHHLRPTVFMGNLNVLYVAIGYYEK